MQYQQLQRQIEKLGLRCRCCSPFHWQILGGRRVINIWPHTKRGLRFQEEGEQVRTGTIKEAIALADAPSPLQAEAPWEGEDELRPPKHRDRVGIIRRFWRWLW